MSKYFEAGLPPGLTLTLSLRPEAGGTAITAALVEQIAPTVSANAVKRGYYLANIGSAAAGRYWADISLTAGSAQVSNGWATVAVADESVGSWEAETVTASNVTAIATAVRDVPNASPASGSLGAAVNAAGGGEVTVVNVVPATLAQDAATPDLITLIRGDVFAKSFTGIGNLSSVSKLWVTFKRSTNDADSASVVQIEAAGGLLRLLGQSATTTDGSITIVDATAGNIVVRLKAAATARLSSADNGSWDVSYLVSGSNGPVTPRTGRYRVVADVTRAVS